MRLSRDDILKRKDLGTEEVEVPPVIADHSFGRVGWRRHE
jgi:hypothetical protein